MCSREPNIRVNLPHVYLAQISFFPDIHRNLERNRQFEVLFPLTLLNERFLFTCSAPAFSKTNVELSLCFLCILSSGAFRDGPLDWNAFDPSFLENKRKKKQTEELSTCWIIYSATQKVPIQGLFCWQNCERGAGSLAQRECTSTTKILFHLMSTLLHLHPEIPTADSGSVFMVTPYQCRCH